MTSRENDLLFLRILTAHANPHATSSFERTRYVLNWTMIGQKAIAIAWLDLTILDVRWPLLYFQKQI